MDESQSAEHDEVDAEQNDGGVTVTFSDGPGGKERFTVRGHRLFSIMFDTFFHSERGGDHASEAGSRGRWAGRGSCRAAG